MGFQTVDKRTVEEIVRRKPMGTMGLITIRKSLLHQRSSNAHGPRKSESAGELGAMCFANADRELTKAFIETLPAENCQPPRLRIVVDCLGHLQEQAGFGDTWLSVENRESLLIRISPMSAAFEFNHFVAPDLAMELHSPVEATGNGRRTEEEVIDSTPQRGHLDNPGSSNGFHRFLVIFAFFTAQI